MKPRQYQLDFTEQAIKIIKENMLVYLAMEERCGKTLVAIMTCEAIDVQRILVLTKKKGIKGWEDTLTKFKHIKHYTVTNYHQAKKFNPKDYDLVILDEAHNYISNFPKRSATWKAVRHLTKGKPLIYLSATPYAQGVQLLFNQLALSDWSPFRQWSSPYSWFRDFGIPDPIYLYGRSVETYKKFRTEEVLGYVRHLFIKARRKELGFKHEPKDKLHYFELSDNVREVYNTLLKAKCIILNDKELLCDTSLKLRCSLHMLEGGVAKIGNEYIILGNTEKIEYIKYHWGDSKNMVIMYNYIAEGQKLAKHFKNATILQATSNAEAIDLYNKEHLIIYSQDFSTARHVQRRARQANMKRETPITVHFLLVKKAISEQVYKTVSINKQNFVDSVFQKEQL